MSTVELTQPTTLLDQLVSISVDQARAIAAQYQTPAYAYSEAMLRQRAAEALRFPAPYGLTVRYAMKANPLAAILKLFSSAGIHIDASSGEEAMRAMQAGIPADHIMLTSQQIPTNLVELVNAGVIYNATSLHQLDNFGQAFPGGSLLIRLNLGTGSGHSRGVAVGGPTSSFGIWHEHTEKARLLAKKHGLHIIGIHSHIGCGTDPVTWRTVAKQTLAIVAQFPEAVRLNLGGGFKVARYPGEHGTNLQDMGESIHDMLTQFSRKTKRQLHLEIEPGTYLVANAGTLIAEVIDLTSTGPNGYHFAKLNTGMNDIMRPALHGSQHPIIPLVDDGRPSRSYVVVGHNCESTDLLTPDPEDSETPLPRQLPELAIGDLVAIEGVGAYCSAMRLVGYNSFTTPNEVLIQQDGGIKLINRRLTFEDFTTSEVS